MIFNFKFIIIKSQHCKTVSVILNCLNLFLPKEQQCSHNLTAFAYH